MNDSNTTINQLKEAVHALCIRKGWGVEGVQNPQHVAMAMTVEMSELLEHFQRLGQLRRAHPPLQQGDITFFQAGDQRLGFTRSLNGRKLKIYVNRNSDPWEIPAGNVLLGHNMQSVAPDWLCLAPMGFCITEDL